MDFSVKSSNIECWRKIQQATLSIVELVNCSTTPEIPQQADVNCPPLELELPFPHEILRPIHELEIPEKTRLDLLQCFTRRVEELQEEFRNTYRRMWQACARFNKGHSIHRMCLSLYERRCFPLIKSMVNKVLTEVDNRQQPRKPVFNTKFRPILETYFEQNAYPSVTDKRALAEATMMTTRQIEVWFQNHRNRAKNEKIIRRSTSDKSLQIALQALNREMSAESADSDCETDVTLVCQSLPDTESTQKRDFQKTPVSFLSERPTHAFPSPYPPKLGSDPFPNKDGVFKFPIPQWRRHPNPTWIDQTHVDINDLCRLFSTQLHLQDGLTKCTAKDRTRRKPWLVGTAIVPCRAPHYALINVVPSHQVPLQPSVVKFGSTSLGTCRANLRHLSVRSKRGRKPFLPMNRPSQPPFSRPKPPGVTQQSRPHLSLSRSSSSSTSTEPTTPPDSPHLNNTLKTFPDHPLDDMFAVFNSELASVNLFGHAPMTEMPHIYDPYMSYFQLPSSLPTLVYS